MTLAASAKTREDFAAAQVEMTLGWWDNLLRSGRDVESYLEARRAAYLVRWREAARYIGRGGRVLDVGGGNLVPALFAFFREMDWDYWYADLGEAEVAHARRLAVEYGFDPAHFSRRLNNELDYEPGAFDAVFSSHCIEHSMDLSLTLAQIHRLLRDGGNFVMSVPFGFDAEINHPYFFSEAEWLVLLEDAGFAIRAYQVGSEYPEVGQDLMIAARKIGAPGPSRLDIARHAKANFAFRDCRDPSVRLAGTQVDKPDRVILDGAWRVDIQLPADACEILPLFIRHDWSGIVSLRCGEAATAEDLFRPYPVTLPMRLALSAPGGTATITPLGRHPASRGAQGVFAGYLVR